METIIQLRPEELTETFFQQLQQLAADSNHIEIRLRAANSVNDLSEEEIDSRLKTVEAGNKFVSFTMDELKTYVHKIAG